MTKTEKETKRVLKSEPPSVEQRELKLATDTLMGDIAEAILTLVRQRNEPWNKLQQHQQQVWIDKARDLASGLVKRSAALVGQSGFTMVPGKVGKVAFGEGKLQAVFKAIDSTENIDALAKGGGGDVLLVFTDASRFMNVRKTTLADLDQTPLPFEMENTFAGLPIIDGKDAKAIAGQWADWLDGYSKALASFTDLAHLEEQALGMVPFVKGAPANIRTGFLAGLNNRRRDLGASDPLSIAWDGVEQQAQGETPKAGSVWDLVQGGKPEDAAPAPDGEGGDADGSSLVQTADEQSSSDDEGSKKSRKRTNKDAEASA
jgi:hypothetical protein